MNSGYFFLQIEQNENNRHFIEEVEKWSVEKKEQAYIIDRPLVENKYKYSYDQACVLLIPRHKITFVNFSSNTKIFEEYCEDFIEDLASLSDKFRYKEEIGRPRVWKDTLIERVHYKNSENFNSIINHILINEPSDQRIIELLISLLTGSINDIQKVRAAIPENLLDKVKQKILLFDADQTRFIYRDVHKKQIRIQGLSGTGKTELLLHKLKDIYICNDFSKIAITCHNKILADNLNNRIPEFFNFMRVEQQIEWNKRLWCVHAWGSQYDLNSGIYSYICNKYGIPFQRWSVSTSFETVCQKAISDLNNIKEIDHAFDYMFIDESQDFSESFFELCGKITKEKVYIAGDIFQGIFDATIIAKISPDFLLSKCYRTDPKTLMFAHALGMGLFEDKKLRWLEDEEWKACGYVVEKESNGSTYYLKREPLRRFEDISKMNFNCVEIHYSDDEFLQYCIKETIEIIKDIIINYPTVKASDIGIILLDNTKQIYAIADALAQLIPREIRWNVNKAYESKQKTHDKIFISNRNNVKGLEFPFIICITQDIYNSYSYRNGLYMSLTRSFLKSYLITSKSSNSSLLEKIQIGLANINKNNCIITVEPTSEEKLHIKTKIQNYQNQSFYDFAQVIFDELNIERQYRDKLFSIVKSTAGDDFDDDNVKEIIEFNYRKMLRMIK
jgi:superfamily I DNA and RNA helicase